MIELEDLKAGITLRGLAGLERTVVVDAEWFGDQAVKLAYRTPEGATGTHVVSADELPQLTLVEQSETDRAATAPRLNEAAAALRQRRRRVSLTGVAGTLFWAETVNLAAAAFLMGAAWEAPESAGSTGSSSRCRSPPASAPRRCSTA